MNKLHGETYKGYKISIFPDDDPENPREWDNLGTMVCFHRRSNYGDQTEFKTPEQLFEFLKEEKPIFMPIFAYEHSGIALSTRRDVYPFNDVWDSGWLGIIYVTREKVASEYGGSNALTDGKSVVTSPEMPAHPVLSEADILSRVMDVLEGEIKVYSQWLNGEFCGYHVTPLDDEDDVLDSTWGYESMDSAIQAAKEFIDWKVEND